MIMPNAFFRTAEADRSAPAASATPAAETLRPNYREREFGVGYGSSSGYASGRHYVERSNATPFRIR